ncbi:MAG: histidinol phosphate phosphatase domain-containing protein, partial [Candidatus Omnitrophota bacterium]
MYNLHSHSLLSDGCLLPSELAMRYQAQGYKILGITDHADYSNIDSIIQAISEFTRHWPLDSQICVIPGVELTHLPPVQFKPLAEYARKKGAKIIVAHGESPVEPVVKGTNRMALLSDIDILAHPGNINDEDVVLAKERGVFLEITSRPGHCRTNNLVVRKALKFGANLIFSTDSHRPEDIINFKNLLYIGKKAGLNKKEIVKINQNVDFFLKERGMYNV